MSGLGERDAAHTAVHGNRSLEIRMEEISHIVIEGPHVSC